MSLFCPFRSKSKTKFKLDCSLFSDGIFSGETYICLSLNGKHGNLSFEK